VSYLTNRPVHPIRFGALLWPQRTDWAGFRSATLAAESAGFDSIWTSDHLLCPTGPSGGAILDGWTMISAIASLTERARIGLIVSANTLRHPALVAKMAVTLDHVSGGRAVAGLGAGWLEPEHVLHGIPFDTRPAARLDRLGEAATIIRQLMDGQTVDHAGEYYQLRGAQHSPSSVQARLPILIGGEGRRRTLRIVAEVADLWNARGSLTTLLDADAALRDHCAVVGRDPESIERMANRWVVVRDDAGDARRVVEAGTAYQGLADVDQATVVAGSPEAVADAFRPLVDAGFRHLVWSLRAPWDLETIERLPEIRMLLTQGDV
jgi:alkanesulfonate monooxygenase SsuD/methylene tetrahydromethanopterin reductase-like flavin-dependent oxidoreductase (luciferase family)